MIEDIRHFRADRLPWDTALCVLIWALLAAAIIFDAVIAIGRVM